MTDEQKQHEAAADTFAAALGAVEGATAAIKPMARYEQRAEETHALHKRDVESAETVRAAQTRDHEQAIALREEEMEMNRRGEARAIESHNAYLLELQHVHATRERDSRAYERIAEALERLTAK